MNAHHVILRAQDISIRYGARVIVERARVKLRRGEFTILVGPNGAGKTTLVRALAGLLPFEGAVELEERALESYSVRQRAKHIAYLPQGNVFHWPMPVRDIVALGRYPHGDAFTGITPSDQEAVTQALAATATTALAGRAVTTLSGGERARVALARALATQAPVLLADEPLASLDARHQLIVMELLRKAARDGGAVLAVMHDLSLAARFADHVLVMQEGRVIAQGEPKDALNAERIAQAFGVEVAMVSLDGETVPIALRPL